MRASNQKNLKTTNRAGIATMEFVLSLPFLMVLMAMIYTLGMRSLDQASVTMDVRSRAWLKRNEMEASSTASKPFAFGVANTGAASARQQKELHVFAWLGGERTSVDETHLIAATWDYQQVKEIRGSDPHAALLSKIGIGGGEAIVSISKLFLLNVSGGSGGGDNGLGIGGEFGDATESDETIGGLEGGRGDGEVEKRGDPAKDKAQDKKSDEKASRIDDLIQKKIDELLEKFDGSIWQALMYSEHYRSPSSRQPDRNSVLWVGVNHYLGYRWATESGFPPEFSYIINYGWSTRLIRWITDGSRELDAKYKWARKGIEDGRKKVGREFPKGFMRHPLFPSIIVGPDGQFMTEEEYRRKYTA